MLTFEILVSDILNHGEVSGVDPGYCKHWTQPNKCYLGTLSVATSVYWYLCKRCRLLEREEPALAMVRHMKSMVRAQHARGGDVTR
jgi:hypothetical protein